MVCGAQVGRRPLVSVEEILRHCGVAKDSVYRWIDRKGPPAHRIDRLWKSKLSEVDDWVREGGAGVTGDGGGVEDRP